MPSITAGKIFISGETVTPGKLNALGSPTVAIDPGDVITESIADGAVTNVKIANGVDAAKLTAGTLPSDRIGSGAITSARCASGLWSSIAPAGAILQVVGASPLSSYTSVSSVIPADDTAPEATEGTEVLTATITPSSTSSKIKVTFSAFVTTGSSTTNPRFVAFRGSTCVQAQQIEGQTDGAMVALAFIDSPATTSATTYSIRTGVNSGSVRFNGTTERLYGGASSANLILEEIKG